MFIFVVIGLIYGKLTFGHLFLCNKAEVIFISVHSITVLGSERRPKQES